MKLTDSRLDRMIARLVSMTRRDQAYVLERLGPDLRDRLIPMLTVVGPQDATSPGLQALVQSVARGEQPQSMTPRAIAVLRSLDRLAGASPTSPGRAQDGLVARVSALIRQSAR